MKKLFSILLLFTIGFLASCEKGCTHEGAKKTVIRGATMGTYYSLSVVTQSRHVDKIELQQKIEKRLRELNDIFSTYKPKSTISKFNEFHFTKAFVVEPEMVVVVKKSLEFFANSQGAFNIAVDPLINLWGFDKDGRVLKRPKNEIVQKVLSDTTNLNLRVGENFLQKSRSHRSINLSAIAKGYAVDDLAHLVKNEGYLNFLVEIGGEFVAHGKNEDKEAWTIGIENPSSPHNQRDLLARVSLKNFSLATSGTYLNFFEDGGKKYSHIIDPRTGYPIERDLISVSIVAKDCMSADALATTALVVGEKQMREILKRYPDAGALFVREKDGSITTSVTEEYRKRMTQGDSF